MFLRPAVEHAFDFLSSHPVGGGSVRVFGRDAVSSLQSYGFPSGRSHQRWWRPEVFDHVARQDQSLIELLQAHDLGSARLKQLDAP